MKPKTQAVDWSWLAPLLSRYRSAITAEPKHAAELAKAYETLRLAAGLARHPRLSTSAPADKATAENPLQVVVVGPTQAGKSSLVNRLLGRTVAGVSALAGHTVHAQAFVQDGAMSEHLHARLREELLPLQACPRESLSNDVLASWSLQSVADSDTALLDQAVVWDTPDFDSVNAGHYREAVLAPAALADVIIVVLSKDKYGDLSVWQRLDALALLGTPLIIVLNKLDAASQGTVSAAFATRWAERSTVARPKTVILPWIEDADRAEQESRIHRELRESLRAASQDAMDGHARQRALTQFIQTHRAEWLAPVQEALQVQARWQHVVDDIEQQALSSYSSRYLNDTERFDVVQRTIAELLHLLELPGLAVAMAKTRQVITWPARTVLGFGRRQWSRRQETPPDRELEVLMDVYHEALLHARDQARIAEDTGDPSGTWRAVDRALATASDTLEAQWQTEAQAIRARFQPRLEAAAQELHQKLLEKPALLNTLRATRATTDAAGVALAVKSGGLAPADLIIAPAMLSITSLLAESALGRYIDTVADRLRRELAELVEEHLIRGVLGDALRELEAELSASGLIGEQMDADLQRALDQMPERALPVEPSR